MDIQLLPFFYCGSAKPVTSTYTQYGLYNPVANRFVLVHSNIKLLTTVAKLFSGRYTLLICQLDCAENFEENLIDNSVCLNWTLSDAGDSKFTSFIQYNKHITKAKKLIPADTNLDPYTLLVADQPYFHYALSWVDDLLPEHEIAASTLGNEIAELISFPFPVQISQRDLLRKEVYQIIYQTFDFEQAKLKIEDLKNNNDYSALNLRIHKI